MKTLGKGLCLCLALIFVLSFAGCKKEETEESKKELEVYTETVFENLKTFSEVTGNELTATDKSDSAKTEYTYSLETKADESIELYKAYLTEYGFVDEGKNDSYTFEENALIFTVEYDDEAGRNVKITLPCDEATINSRNEAICKEAEEAFNNKDYDKVTEIAERISGEYEGIKYYKDIATGIKYYNNGKLQSAYATLEEYTDYPEAKTIVDKIASYNGIYRYDNNRGAILYINIRNGRVSQEIASKYSPETSYKQGEAAYYIYTLVERDTEKGGRQIMIASSANMDDYKYLFMPPTDGSNEYIVISYETNPYTTYNGVYTKVSSTPPSAK